MRYLAAMLLVGFGWVIFADEKKSQTPEPLPAVQQELLHALDDMQPELVAMNQDIWAYAELGLQEYRSAGRLATALQKAGFRVTEGVSGMPTAFVAEFGSGRPVIGILAEYDALPELAQQVSGQRQPIPGQAGGHGCGHCALGTAAVGAALAVKNICAKHHLPGTVRLYGTPAEETVIGKVYMTLDDQFKDLDVCLHWHPGNKNRIAYFSTKAMVSAKFTFTGLAAHASGSPEKGRSALDAVELMNVGVNYMREHIKESSRIHYVVTNGGQQPNVVPATAQVWYYVRANTHEDAEYLFDWVVEIAEAGAKMARTKMALQVDTDCHEVIPNLPLSKVVARNWQKIGPPVFDDADRKLASQLQEPLRSQFGLKETKPLEEAIEEIPAQPYAADGGSTDVGDVSWHVPTAGFSTVCFAAGSPGHSWQNVAAIGSPLGHKGMMIAAKILALSTVDLLQDPQAIADGKKDFVERMRDRKYTTKIPKGQKAPKAIR
jgi:aminobenzoyl-glutamate utilization protein B